MKTFNKRFVLISGGSSGIGLALANEFAKRGSNICILARREEVLAKAILEIKSHCILTSQVVIGLSLDVTNRELIKERILAIISEHGTPDILINSAGVAHPGQFEELEMEIFDWMINVNYMGTVNMCKAIIPYMLERQSGTIVNISSVAGFLGVYGYTAYCGSKFAVKGFSDALRSEMKPHNINVQIVFPPDTQTPQLDYENQYKPRITKALSSSAGVMPADKVAQEIIKGIQRGSSVIIPGFESKLMYGLSSLLGKWMYPLMDLMVKNAAKK